MEQEKKPVPTTFVITLSLHIPDFFVRQDRQMFHLFSIANLQF